MELRINNLSKRYGTVLALDDFTSCMTPGIYGLLGANGAGKSTLMKLICQLVKADSGQILWQQEDVSKHPHRFQSLIGYMPQHQDLYEEFSAQQFLYYMAALKEMDQKNANEQIQELLDVVGLSTKGRNKIKTFSGGMKQRLLIAQALLNKPQLLIFDEPTAGLDPNQRIQIRNFFFTLAKDHIVIICTHVVQDIDSIAKEIIFLDHGKQLFQASSTDITKRLNDKVYELVVLEEKLFEYQQQEKISNIQRVDGGYLIRVIREEKPENGLPCIPTLEDAYLYYIGYHHD